MSHLHPAPPQFHNLPPASFSHVPLGPTWILALSLSLAGVLLLAGLVTVAVVVRKGNSRQRKYSSGAASLQPLECVNEPLLTPIFYFYFSSYPFFFKILFIYSLETQREGGRDTGRGRSRLHEGSLNGTRSRDPRITPWAEGRCSTAGPPRRPIYSLYQVRCIWLINNIKLLLLFDCFSVMVVQMTVAEIKSTKICETRPQLY